MNKNQKLLIIELLKEHLKAVDWKLENNEQSRQLRKSIGDPTDIHDKYDKEYQSKKLLAEMTLLEIINTYATGE